MTESGRLALPDVCKWSGGPFECPAVVGRPYRVFGNGWEALPDVLERSRGPPVC